MLSRLDRLLAPAGIAVIGGDRAGRVIENCRQLGFAGDLWAVNPHRETLAGVDCVATVDDLPGTPDAAFVAVDNAATVDVVGRLAALGAGGAVCYAAGFSETGDEELSRRLVEAAGPMPLIGPNCHGFINALSRVALWPDQHGCVPVDSGAALITQSGNMGISLSMQQRGLDLAGVYTLGNQVSVNVAECLHALLDDGRITAVGIHVEGMADAQAFGEAAARALELGIPIVVLDTGRTAHSAIITRSHTASLQSDGTAMAALFDRYGVARVDRLPDLIETLNVVSRFGPLQGNRMASLSCSGGEASLVADRAGVHGVAFAEFPPDQAEGISAVLGDRVTVTNPLDYHTFIWGDGGALTDLFTRVTGGPQDATMLIMDVPNRDGDPSEWWPTLDAFVDAQRTSERPALVVSTLGENLTDAVRSRLAATGIPAVSGIDEALGAVGRAAWIGSRRAAIPGPHAPASPPASIRVVDEAGAKRMIADAGIPVPPGAEVPHEGVVAAAETIGYPVALKAVGYEHKAEAGAVAIGIADPAALARALVAMPVTESYLVERHITGAIAELVVSIRRAPPVGWVITLGHGGRLVELAVDVAYLLAPATPQMIRDALHATKAGVLLDGYRGAPPGDLDAVVDAVDRLQRAALASSDVVEIEINPLLVLPSGVWAVDASATVEASP